MFCTSIYQDGQLSLNDYSIWGYLKNHLGIPKLELYNSNNVYLLDAYSVGVSESILLAGKGYLLDIPLFNNNPQ